MIDTQTSSKNSTQKSILAAGLDIFSHRGFHEVRLEDILDKTGLTKSDFYESYADFRTLYLEVLNHAAEEVLNAVVLDPNLPFEKALDQVVSNFVAFSASRPCLIRSLIAAGIDPGKEEKIYTLVTQVKNVITERISERMGISEEIAFAHLLIRGSIGFVESAVLTWIDRKYMHQQQLVEVINGALHTSLIPLAKQLPGVR